LESWEGENASDLERDFSSSIHRDEMLVCRERARSSRKTDNEGTRSRRVEGLWPEGRANKEGRRDVELEFLNGKKPV